MTTEQQPSTEQVVYTGRRRIDSTRKLVHWYRPLVDGALDEREFGAPKAYAGAPIGAIVEITRPADEPNMLYTSGQHEPRLVGAFSDQTLIEQWRVRDRAEAQRDANERRIRRDLDGIPEEFSAALDVLARHFAKLNTPQRAALMSLVTAKLLRF